MLNRAVSVATDDVDADMLDDTSVGAPVPTSPARKLPSLPTHCGDDDRPALLEWRPVLLLAVACELPSLSLPGHGPGHWGTYLDLGDGW